MVMAYLATTVSSTNKIDYHSITKWNSALCNLFTLPYVFMYTTYFVDSHLNLIDVQKHP
jgi:hypothetical protein